MNSVLIENFLSGGGEMGVLIRSYDWGATSLGPPSKWPQSLKTSVAIMLKSGYTIFVWWGPSMIMLYNDAYIPVMGKKHPYGLGKPAAEIWSEIWDQIGPMMDQVLNKGQQIYANDLLFLIERKGFIEETYFTFSYSPIPNDDGGVGGIFCACNEETSKVLRQRRLKTLQDISALTIHLRSEKLVCDTALRVISENPNDIPFSLLYTLNEKREPVLSGSTGFGWERESVPTLIKSLIDLWDLNAIITQGEPEVVSHLSKRIIGLPRGPWKESPETAIIIPFKRSGHDQVSAFIIFGISPKLDFDEEYQSYLDLVARQIATSLANVHAFEEERKRAEALAEIDKAKTIFFSNISHEFRTPLTLMLGPLEEVLNNDRAVKSDRDQLAVVHRNSLRLLKLVNTLLDFSRLEAGRTQARFRPVDLSAITEELSSVFRSAIEKAGITFSVQTERLPEKVFVDPSMWEKIIFNLLSNAFKFTLQGKISVTVSTADGGATVSVADTGTGIPQSELTKLFTRFHRIEGAKGRTHEGSGIGLAMVNELVKLHGGNVNVATEIDRGTTFTVFLRYGKDHLDPGQVAEEDSGPIMVANRQLVEQELEMYTDGLDNPNQPGFDTVREHKILVADDNADMRNYLEKLLNKNFIVKAVPDGQLAYESLVTTRYDLVLSDIMMPKLDGIALLKKIRTNDDIKSTPVILLSARAGEEAKVEGIETGADDYLIKPFSAKELLARVHTHLLMSKSRKELLLREIHLTNELKASEQRYKNAYDALHNLFMQVPAMVCILRGPEFEFEWVNPAYQKLFGNRPLVGRKLLQALPEVEGQGIVELLKGVYQTGEPFVGKEFLVMLARDEGLPLEKCYFNFLYQAMYDVNNSITGVIAFGYEVTEQVGARNIAEEWARELEIKIQERTAELVTKNEELKQQKDFIETVLNTSVDLICVYDKDGRFMAMNRKCAELTRVDPSHIVGKSFEEVYPDLKNSDVHRNLLHALRGQPLYNVIYKSGYTSNVYSNFYIPLKRDDEIYGAVVIAHDITTIMESAEKLKVANEELLRSNQELEQFAYIASHDLQEPLRKIRTFSEMFMRNSHDKELSKKYFDKVTSSAERMASLIRDVLNYSRLSKDDKGFQAVDLNDILEKVKSDYELLIEEKKVVIRHEKLPVIHGIALQLSQLFANLINNSIKFCERNPEITISWETIAGEKIIQYPKLNPSCAYARLSFRDNGIGFDEQYANQVFTIFKRLNHNRYSGTGIGLALCKKIVDNHGGLIDVSSRVDEGTIFTVVLPLDVAEAGQEGGQDR